MPKNYSLCVCEKKNKNFYYLFYEDEEEEGWGWVFKSPFMIYDINRKKRLQKIELWTLILLLINLCFAYLFSHIVLDP